MKRDYPERPFVGVGVIIWRDDKVLLVQRGRPPRQGEWSLPGGAQHLGESLEEAARREVKEETGLSVHIVGLVDVIDAIIKDDGGRIKNHYSLIDFVAHSREGEAVAGDDACAVRWVSLEELESFALWEETTRVIHQSAEIMKKSALSIA